MKKTRLILLALLALLSTVAMAQTYTFQCVSESAMTGDSCEGCVPWQIQSRSFDGLVIWESGVFYRWIEIPYTLKVRGDTVDIWEHTSPPSRLGKNQFYPDRISITLAQTPFSTIQGFVDSVWCNRPANGTDTLALFYASDSIDTAPIYRGDTLTIVGRDLAHVTFDSLLKKYVVQVDSISGGGSTSLTNTQIAYGDASNLVTSDANFTRASGNVYINASGASASLSVKGSGGEVGNFRTSSNADILKIANDGSVTVGPLANTGLKFEVQGSGAGILLNRTDDDPFIIIARAGTYVGQFRGITGGGIRVTEATAANEIIKFQPSGKVGVNVGFANNVAASAQFEVGGTVGGILPPRLTTTQRNAISSPAAGLHLYNSTTGNFTWYDGSTWREPGAGTVTSVGLSLPSIFSVSGSPVTTSGTLTGTLATQSANLVFAGPTAGGAATPTFRSLVTADLANQIVTYAKIQNVTSNRLLGRATAGSGTVEEITLGTGLSYTGTTLNVSGFPSGTGTANRFTLWTGTNTLGDDAAFTFDGTNDRMTITGSVAATGSNNAWLNLNGGSLTGTAEAWRASGNISGSLNGLIANARNIGNSGNAQMEVQVGGTSAGDPFYKVTVPGGSSYVFGIDNTDDKFKITPDGTAPGSTANKGMVITADATTLVGINKDAPSFPLDVSGPGNTGIVRADQFRNTGSLWSGANISFGTGAGTGPSINSISGGNNGFQINFTAGTTPTAGGRIFTATYPTPFSNLTYVVKSERDDPGGTNVLNEWIKFGLRAEFANSFELHNPAGAGALVAGRQYALSFIIFGY